MTTKPAAYEIRFLSCSCTKGKKLWFTGCCYRVYVQHVAKKRSQQTAGEIERTRTVFEAHDYIGAISLLEHKRQSGDDDITTTLWLAYCACHADDYRKAAEMYEWLLSQKNCPTDVFLYLGCCFFFMAMYDDARHTAERAHKSPLQNRLLFYVAHKLKDEKKLMLHHSQLKDTIEDQMCLAAIHFLREHYQEAIDLYKKILQKNKNFLALNVYLALCYYKLDYYDVSMEVLQPYLNAHPDSAIAVNLKACNHYRLYNSKAAENELKSLRHLATSEANFGKDIVVFRNGDAALQVLPALVDVIPEARMNLCIYHLKKNDVDSAYELMKNQEGGGAQYSLLKAITFSIKGYDEQSQELLETAANFFKTFGESPSDCDTIAGRQSMASAYFLWKQFDEVLVYLNSIKTFFVNDELFAYNYGQALVQMESFEEAESVLASITNSDLTNELCYQLSLARAYIRNGKAKDAWSLYEKVKHTAEAPQLLRLVANDCYIAENYVYSLRAFDELERRDTIGVNVAHCLSAKQGSFMGALKQFANGKATISPLMKKQKKELKARAHLFKQREGFTYHYVNITYKKGAKFGLIIKTADKDVLVSKLEPNSLCANQLAVCFIIMPLLLSYQIGDRLIDVDGEPVNDREQAKKLMLQRLAKTRKVSFIVERPVSDEAKTWAKNALFSASTRTSSTAPREKAIWAAKAAQQRQAVLLGKSGHLAKRGSSEAPPSTGRSESATSTLSTPPPN
ncbi:Tetratricopeptide repeat protein 26 [Aphelenchoides besseyi]|nr:Tetratricopeptide repeat protein 26 [Aphelenchoides besseyi]